jgi:hypothetical protein
VEGFPTLNVDNKSKTASFPFAVLGCTDPDVAIAFGPKGSPLTVGTKALVNGIEVDIKSFSVANTVSRPDNCDGGAPLADLQLQLNRLQVINAILSRTDGTCQNGPTEYVVRVGQGFYVFGTDTVELTNCD